MILKLSDLLCGKCDSIPFESHADADELGLDLTGTVSVGGTVRYLPGCLPVDVIASIDANAVCGRCARRFDFKNQYSFTLKLTDKLEDSDSDEFIPLEDESVDVDRVCLEWLMLNLPPNILCSDSCKGLCNVCGADKNESDCGCSGKECDPRLVALKDFFD